MENDPGIGHNQPPDPLLTEAAERVENANRWLSERSDWEKWDLETADKANFFLAQIGATWSALNDRRLEEGRAFKEQQDKVYKDPLTLLNMAKEKLAPLRRLWLKREEDRLEQARKAAEAEAAAKAKAAEEAAQRAREVAGKKGALEDELAAGKAQEEAARAAEAVQAVPERAQIKGAYTTTASSLRDYWSAEIVDLSAAFKHYNKKGNPAKATIEAAIRDAIFDIANAEAKRAKTVDAAKFPPGVIYKKDRR